MLYNQRELEWSNIEPRTPRHKHYCPTCEESTDCSNSSCIPDSAHEHYACWQARTGYDEEPDIEF